MLAGETNRTVGSPPAVYAFSTASFRLSSVGAAPSVSTTLVVSQVAKPPSLRAVDDCYQASLAWSDNRIDSMSRLISAEAFES